VEFSNKRVVNNKKTAQLKQYFLMRLGFNLQSNLMTLQERDSVLTTATQRRF